MKTMTMIRRQLLQLSRWRRWLWLDVNYCSYFANNGNYDYNLSDDNNDLGNDNDLVIKVMF